MNVELETARLKLRPFTLDDVNLLVDLDADPNVMRYINGGEPIQPDVIQRVALPKILSYDSQPTPYGYWATFLKASEDFIGWFQFVPATDARFVGELGVISEGEVCLGYRLKQAYWGQGYATEGARLLVELGFDNPAVTKIGSWALAANRGSTRVMEKAGLDFEQTFEFTAEQLPNLAAEERKAMKYSLVRTP